MIIRKGRIETSITAERDIYIRSFQPTIKTHPLYPLDSLHHSTLSELYYIGVAMTL